MTSRTVTFGSEELGGALRLLSYHPNTVALIPFLISEAASGNMAPIASQFLMIRDSLSDTLSLGMHNAVICTEDTPFFAAEAVSDDELRSTYLGPMLRDGLRDICAVWPVGVIDDNFKEPLATDIPVLLLSGESDPITPPEFAVQAAVELDNFFHHVGPLQGHGQAPRGCMPDVMAEFVESADVTTLDAGCLNAQFAMPFFLDFSGPAP